MASGPRITIASAVSNVALTATSSTTWTYSWSTSGVSAGSYTVTVTGTDLAGNAYAGSDEITIRIDSTAPTVTLKNSDSDNLLAASDTVSITTAFSEAMTATPTISISGLVTNVIMNKISVGPNDSVSTQLGQDIDGEGAGDISGLVSLSSDGSRVAIGATLNGPYNSLGHVRIYDYNGSSWVQVGADIDGETLGGHTGYVSISSDGSRVAVGAGQAAQSTRGQVIIYDFNGTAWVKVGGNIVGESAGDRSGLDVSLSDDGTRVAIGAVSNSGNGTYSGHVRVFQYQVISGTATWTQLGADIDGEAARDYSGSQLSLSSDGSRVAIGAPFNDAGNSGSDNRGH